MNFMYNLIMTWILQLSPRYLSSKQHTLLDFGKLFIKSEGMICRDILYDVQLKKIYKQSREFANAGYGKLTLRMDEIHCDPDILAEKLKAQGYDVRITASFIFVEWKK